MFIVFTQQINWNPVIWGLLLQFGLGLFILRWPTGFQACQWLGDQVTIFLGYTDEGSKFVFGEKYTYHPVVFVVRNFDNYHLRDYFVITNMHFACSHRKYIYEYPQIASNGCSYVMVEYTGMQC